MLTGGQRFKRNIENEVTYVNLFVFREGAIETISPIYLEYDNAAPQAKWRAFLISVAEALKLQAIDGIYTEVEGYYVARVSSLQEGGRYMVRPTENSSLTRSLTVDKLGQYPAWEIVDRGREARELLIEAVAEHSTEYGPLPPIPSISMPWIQPKPKKVLTTAAQVRAAAAAKQLAAADAKEAARLARKAARAKARCEAAIVHVIRPDSVEGLFQGLDYLQAQQRRDKEAKEKGGVCSDFAMPPDLSLLALRALSRYARTMLTADFLDSKSLEKAFKLHGEAEKEEIRAIVKKRRQEREEWAIANGESVDTLEKNGNNDSKGKIDSNGGGGGVKDIEGKGGVIAAVAAGKLLNNKKSAQTESDREQGTKEWEEAKNLGATAEADHWLFTVILNVCNRPRDKPALRQRAQDASVHGGGLAIALRVIGRDSHVVGRGRGSPVVVALQAFYAMIRENKPNRSIANNMGALNLIATKGLDYQASSASDSSASSTASLGGENGNQSKHDKRPRVPTRNSAVMKEMIAAHIIDGGTSKHTSRATTPTNSRPVSREDKLRSGSREQNSRPGSSEKSSRPGSKEQSSRPGSREKGNSRPNSKDRSRSKSREKGNSSRPSSRDRQSSSKSREGRNRSNSRDSNEENSGSGSNSRSSSRGKDQVDRPTPTTELSKWRPGDPLPHVVPLLPSSKPTTKWPIVPAVKPSSSLPPAVSRYLVDTPIIDRSGPELMAVSHARYTIWCLHELILDDLVLDESGVPSAPSTLSPNTRKKSSTVRPSGTSNYGVVACCSTVLAGRCYYDEEVSTSHERLIDHLRFAHGAVQEVEEDSLSRASSRAASRAGSQPMSPKSPLKQGGGGQSSHFSFLATMAVDENEELVTGEGDLYMENLSPELKAQQDAQKKQLALIDESIRLGHIAGFFQS